MSSFPRITSIFVNFMFMEKIMYDFNLLIQKVDFVLSTLRVIMTHLCMKSNYSNATFYSFFKFNWVAVIKNTLFVDR